MQTFLSENTFYDSARALDNVRLQKQYLEGWQILDAISKTPLGGGQRINGRVPFASNHPATNQWRGYEGALYGYLALVEVELKSRGIKTDVLQAKIERTFEEAGFDRSPGCGLPPWWKDLEKRDRMIYTHRASLYKKDNEHYAQYRAFGECLDLYRERLVCCPGKHADYYYPTHKDF